MVNEYGEVEDASHRTERLFQVGDEVRVQGRDELFIVSKIVGRHYGLVFKNDQRRSALRSQWVEQRGSSDMDIAVHESVVYQLGGVE